jgi:hypothetical protein
MSDIHLVGIDTDGSTVWRNANAELDEKYNSGEQPTDEEYSILFEAGWNGITVPWEIPDEPDSRCTSDDPNNHQGDTCPVHEAS